MSSLHGQTISIGGSQYRLEAIADGATRSSFAAAIADKFAAGGRWTVREVAQAAQETEATIRKRTRMGALKAARQRPYLYNPQEVRRYLEGGAR